MQAVVDACWGCSEAGHGTLNPRLRGWQLPFHHTPQPHHLLKLGGPAGEGLGVEAAQACSLQHSATVGAACALLMPVRTPHQPPALPHMRIAPASSTMMACGQAGPHLGLQEQGPVIGQQEGGRSVAHFLLHLQRQASCTTRAPAMRGHVQPGQ